MIYVGIATTPVLRIRAKRMFSEDAGTRCLSRGFTLVSASGLVLIVPLVDGWLTAGSPGSVRMKLIMTTIVVATRIVGCCGALLVAKALPGFLAEGLGGPADSGL
jgi:hypothetical protein